MGESFPNRGPFLPARESRAAALACRPRFLGKTNNGCLHQGVPVGKTASRGLGKLLSECAVLR
jgi:hypothetical protein